MPMHVAALVVLGPQPRVPAARGPMTLELLRATIGQRLHRVPRLRQALSPPSAGGERPYGLMTSAST